MKDFFDFSGRRYLVTGASSGLGRTVSEKLADCGANLLITGRSLERLIETKDILTGTGHAVYVKDLMDEDYTDLFDFAEDRIGKLDGIIHCAGIASVLPISTLTRKRTEECMTSNLFSLIELVRLFSKKKFRPSKGSVVAVSSVSALYPDKCQTIYAASKAAIITAVQGMALELVKSGIRINSVIPGSMDTAMAEEALGKMGQENVKKKLSKQILGITSPGDVANVILFLLSDMSAAITGRAIFTDGGYINL